MKHFNTTSRTMLLLMVLMASLNGFAQTNVTLPTKCNSCLSGIGALDCAGATKSGDIMAGTPTNNAYYSIPYTGGTGTAYEAVSVNSTGVTGLSATIAAGTFATGSGTLKATISGFPSAAGTATFALSIGGQSCSLTWTVTAANSVAKICPVNMGGGVVRNWLCHNLGADNTVDSHIGSYKINGAYIRWGMRGPNITGDATVDWPTSPNNASLGFRAAPTGITSATQNAGAISGWTKFLSSYDAWNTGTEAAPIKTALDPCPKGYRIPTITEWDSLANNNVFTVVGISNKYNATSTPSYYDLMYHFGPDNSNFSISFPAAGFDNDGTTVSFRGEAAVYMPSSTPTYVMNRVQSVSIGPAINGYRRFEYVSSYGYPVRCIAE